MSKNVQKWPTISIPREDQDMIKKINSYPGVLHLFKMEDILMIAAALAVELDAPMIDDMQKYKNKVDVTHGSLLAGPNNDEYRQYMLLIYYATKANHDLSAMGDLKDVVANYIDYAHRGLQIMGEEYLKNGGPEEFEKKFAKYLNRSIDIG